MELPSLPTTFDETERRSVSEGAKTFELVEATVEGSRCRHALAHDNVQGGDVVDQVAVAKQRRVLQQATLGQALYAAALVIAGIDVELHAHTA